MESLMKLLLNRASEEDGEAWLRRCLEPATASEDEEEASCSTSQRTSAGQWVDEPAEERYPRRGMATRRSSPAAAGTEDAAVDENMAAEVGGGQSGGRTGGKRAASSRSPASSGRRGGTKKPATQAKKGGPSPVEVPRPPSVVRNQQPAVGQANKLQNSAVQSESMDRASQQGAGGPPVADLHRTVWILGHSFIHWAHKRATHRPYTVNLSLQPESFRVLWKGVRGLQWHQLHFHLSRLLQVWPPPSILVLHLGGNDLGNLRTVDLLSCIKRDLGRFHAISPNTVIIFSEIVPRLAWLSSDMRRVMERMRKRVNRAMEKFMPTIGGLSYRHIDLEGGVPGFYTSDGVHFSEIGLDLFNLGLQSSIEMAVVVGVGRA
ncbi:uncharacterized protein LOC120942791 [Rana temporaria]|uniref:uncharacterized protein LOC120942791 n=1 Tax=Rana temporaria TaxID=8407 RepID=UPI001AAD33FE|nr:uncharacterized protein LOC120942791 [Rana temporaria]